MITGDLLDQNQNIEIIVSDFIEKCYNISDIRQLNEIIYCLSNVNETITDRLNAQVIILEYKCIFLK